MYSHVVTHSEIQQISVTADIHMQNHPDIIFKTYLTKKCFLGVHMGTKLRAWQYAAYIKLI